MLMPFLYTPPQEIKKCMDELLEGKESMNDLLPRFCWRLLQVRLLPYYTTYNASSITNKPSS